MPPRRNVREILLPEHILGKKIIIIGAGISGLTCAEKLQKRGFKNVNILEASDRIGGRLYSWGCQKRKVGTEWSYFEMGSQRVHRGTSLYKIAEKERLIDPNAPEYSKAIENLGLMYNSHEVEAISSIRRYLCNRLYFPEDFCEILNDKEFRDIFETSERPVIKCMQEKMKGVYNWWLNGMAYEYIFNPDQSELVFGYSGILHSIRQKLANGTIVSKQEVVKIDYTDFWNANVLNPNVPKIKVKCKGGSIFEADHVIVTIPLGYLKAHFTTLFSPPLPEDKIIAIQSLKYITVNKIFLIYEESFWDVADVYHVIWTETLDDVFRRHRHVSGQDPLKWVRCINRFEYVYTQPNALCAWIWGEGAEIMEKLRDDEVICCSTMLLSRILKKYLPQPSQVFRSNWHSNEHFHGSLIYDPTRPIHHHLRKMSESVSVKGELILQFAGDATADTGVMSTVHGARQSGRRAARELHVQCMAEARISFEDDQVYSDSD